MLLLGLLSKGANLAGQQQGQHTQSKNPPHHTKQGSSWKQDVLGSLSGAPSCKCVGVDQQNRVNVQQSGTFLVLDSFDILFDSYIKVVGQSGGQLRFVLTWLVSNRVNIQH